jgi:hypothetical protein
MDYDPKDAIKHIVHDYIYLVAAGTDTQRPQRHPFNHYAERTFLIHCRSIAKFFSGTKDICARRFTRGQFTPSLPTWGKWKTHVNMHLMHLTRGRIMNKTPWTGEPNRLMLKEFRSAWRGFLNDLTDELKPLFQQEIEKHRQGFTGYQL